MPSAVILFEVIPRRYPHEIDRWRGIQLTGNTLDQEMASTGTTSTEVIRGELRALIARDRTVETWLTNQVSPAYDALKADPSRAITADQASQP